MDTLPQVKTPRAGTGTDAGNLADAVWANGERFGDAVSFRLREHGSWMDLTSREFAGRVLDVAKGLIAGGLRHGDQVALPVQAGFAAAVLEFATWTVGATVVTDGLPARLRVTDAARTVDELAERGAGVADETAHARRLAVRGAEPAVRGRFGELTHGDLLAVLRSTSAAAPTLFRAGNSMLVHLPHGADRARPVLLAGVHTRTTIGHLPDLEQLGTDLGTFRPTAIVATPALFDQVHASARERAHAAGHGRLFDAAEEVAVAWGRSDGPCAALRIKHAAADRFVFNRIRATLGGRCLAAVSVAGRLEDRVAWFLRGVGVTVRRW